MSKRITYLIVIATLLVGVTSAAFDFPSYANRLISKIPGAPHVPERAFQFGLDLQGGVHLVYGADLSSIESGQKDAALEGLRDVIERRVNLFGVKEPVVQLEGTGDQRRLIVELAGIDNPQDAVELIGQTPYLEFREPKPNFEEIQEQNQKVLETGEGTLEDPFAPTQLTGRYLEKSEVALDPVTSSPIIQLQFNDEGSKLFEEITARNIEKPLAIFLDYQLLTAPLVQSSIAGGKAQITGNFTIEEAQKLARNLNAGALPIPVTLLSQEHVGPTLGKISLEQSLRAGIWGLLLVTVFMVAFYRFPGAIASFALLVYLLLLLSIFKVVPVTLTLAGIAGVILSVGMAVDANVLIFSRMREELKSGKSLSIALEEGFRRAWPSIRDGNITTLIVGVILFWLGTSFVQGFAFSLVIGILLSMVTAILVTRGFMGMFSQSPLGKIVWIWK